MSFQQGSLTDAVVVARQLSVLRVLDEFGSLELDCVCEALRFGFSHKTDVKVMSVLMRAALRDEPDLLSGNACWMALPRRGDVAQLLLGVGADVTAVVYDDYGSYVLHEVLPINVLSVYLKAGASLHARDGVGRTPLHVAVESRGWWSPRPDSVRWFIEVEHAYTLSTASASPRCTLLSAGTSCSC